MIGPDKDVEFEPFFLETDSKRLFCVFFPPAGEARGNYLFVPPFAEEMNRCRSMVAMQSRALCNNGFGVLLVDLFGTGDSSGEFGEATWASWKESLNAGCRWLAAKPGPRRGVWGLRLGALLAAEMVNDGLEADHLLFWQPVVNGKTMLTQFLRIKVAASMDLNVDAPSTDAMRAQFKAGSSVEIGGYELNPELALAIDAAILAEGRGFRGLRVEWLETSAVADATLAPASSKAVAALRESGARVEASVHEGPPFWQLHERSLAPRLIEITTARVLSHDA
jgi:exosortase A-associated hydrolase 2